MLLTKEQIVAAPDIGFEDVAVPEWGGTVRVRGMTGTQRDAYEQSLFAGRSDEGGAIANVRARLAAYSLVDEAGELLFTEAEVEALGKKSAAALDRVVEASRRVSALSQEDIDALGKPSAATAADASTSSSPAS